MNIRFLPFTSPFIIPCYKAQSSRTRSGFTRSFLCTGDTSLRAHICHTLYLCLFGVVYLGSPSRESSAPGRVGALPRKPGCKTSWRKRLRRRTRDPRRGCRSNRSSQRMCRPRRELRRAAGTGGRKAGRAGLRALAGPRLRRHSGLQASPAVRAAGAKGQERGRDREMILDLRSSRKKPNI